eukprot:4708401-Pleurochrysis_carterae.AAC.1
MGGGRGGKDGERERATARDKETERDREMERDRKTDRDRMKAGEYGRGNSGESSRSVGRRLGWLRSGQGFNKCRRL